MDLTPGAGVCGSRMENLDSYSFGMGAAEDCVHQDGRYNTEASGPQNVRFMRMWSEKGRSLWPSW